MRSYTLRYGQSQLQLTKSEDTVAVVPRPGAERRAAIASLARAEDTEITLAGFCLARVLPREVQLNEAGSAT